MGGDGRRRFDRPGDGSSRVDTDGALRLLSDPLCRFVIGRLAELPGDSANLDDLIESYVERTEGVGRDSVELQCRHAHLPALAAAGVVDFDEQSGDVRYYPDPLIEEVLEVVERRGA